MIIEGRTLESIEKDIIYLALKRNNFNRTRTALELDIGLRTIQRKIKRYFINGEIPDGVKSWNESRR